jgi:D-amino peptidase
MSVDMEGISGISHPDPTRRHDKAYASAVELMEGETNAAIEGVLAGGATEVVVNDGHGGMFNLSPAAIHAEARLMQGQKALSMVEGAAEGSFGVALFVGYHARAGHPRGTIAHTYDYSLTLATLNGRPVGECGLNALYLGDLGIPVGLVSGDDAVAEEVAAWLPGAERVVVKYGAGGFAANSLHPERARILIRDAARRAVERALAGDKGLIPFRPEPPIFVGMDFHWPAQADHAALIPGFKRTGDRGVVYETDRAVDAYRAFLAAARMARLVNWSADAR